MNDIALAVIFKNHKNEIPQNRLIPPISLVYSCTSKNEALSYRKQIIKSHFSTLEKNIGFNAIYIVFLYKKKNTYFPFNSHIKTILPFLILKSSPSVQFKSLKIDPIIPCPGYLIQLNPPVWFLFLQFQFSFSQNLGLITLRLSQI